MGKFILGTLFIIAAVSVCIFLTTSNVKEQRTVDISAIKAERIIEGTSLARADFKVSVVEFVTIDYEYVLVGVDSSRGGELEYFGVTKEGISARAKENFHIDAIQVVRDVEIKFGSLRISLDRDWSVAASLSALASVILGGIGLVLITSD